MTATWGTWKRSPLVGHAIGVTDKHGMSLAPMPGPDEVIVSICAKDGARAHVIIPKGEIPTALLAALEGLQAENRAVRTEYRAERVTRPPLTGPVHLCTDECRNLYHPGDQ